MCQEQCADRWEKRLHVSLKICTGGIFSNWFSPHTWKKRGGSFCKYKLLCFGTKEVIYPFQKLYMSKQKSNS